MGRRVIRLQYRPSEGISPTHVLRAFTAALEDQERTPSDRDDQTVDLAALAEQAGAGTLRIDLGTVACHPVGDGGPPGLVLEFAASAEDGATGEAVEAGCRSFATAALLRRLGGRSLTEVDELTLDLDPTPIDLTAQSAASPAGTD
jgi:hypothetical protein